MLLQKENIHLRALEPEDLEILYDWENNTEIWPISNTLVPFSRYVLKKYLETSHHDIFETKQLRLVIELQEKSNIPIGLIDLFDFEPFHRRAGVGILIAETESRGKGYGRIALDLLTDYCFDVLDLHQLYCNIGADNIQSLALFERAGFRKIGLKKDWIKVKTGWYDEYLLQKIRLPR